MALDEAGRRDVWARWMRENTAAVGLTKADLRAAVDALDDWLDDNAASANAALPEAARTALSQAQKAHLLAFVALRRYGG